MKFEIDLKTAVGGRSIKQTMSQGNWRSRIKVVKLNTDKLRIKLQLSTTIIKYRYFLNR